jgi:hypothetical protein
MVEQKHLEVKLPSLKLKNPCEHKIQADVINEDTKWYSFFLRAMIS